MDPFARDIGGLESPARHIAAVVPNDTTDLTTPSRALCVATAGMLRLTTVAGDEATVFVTAGVPFPVRARRVWATGSTATGVVALW